MAKRRSGQIQLTFDSLTDLMTNLAGGLILLVLLVMGMTRGLASSTARQSGGSEKSQAAQAQTARPTVPVAPIEQRVERLRRQVEEVERVARATEQELERARAELEELLKKYQSLEEPEADPPPQVDHNRLTVRPPMLKTTVKSMGLALVCDGGNVRIFDMKTCREIIQSVPLQQILANGIDIEDSDYRLSYDAEEGMISVEKPGRPGESLEQAMRDGSNMRRLLDALDSQHYYVQLFVFPDSFAAFHELKPLILARKLDFNWEPGIQGTYDFRVGTRIGPEIIQPGG